MKKLFMLLMLVITTLKLSAQCTSGDCTNGKGGYNYGWCIYSGEFKNGKPDGQGTMKYDDHTYNGSFVNGLEDGEGVYTNKDGRAEKVKYTAGVKTVIALEKIAAADYKPLIAQDVNCLDGNCITGYGTYKFPSGNKYTGNFKEYKREGQGVFYFTNGDKFDGVFNNNEKVSGTYSFSTGAKYKGTYDNRGIEYNGMITSVTGMSIPYVNGKPIIPPAPKIAVNTSNSGRPNGAATERLKTPCLACYGTGKTSRLEDWSNYGAAQGGNREYRSTVRVYTSCYRCHGSGVN
jgi:hypothetical protein